MVQRFHSAVQVHPAVISVWAALIASAHLLPAVALVGTGGTLSVSTCLLPLAGIFFGPVAGTLCAAIGSFIGYLIAPSGAWLGMFTFIIPTLNALIAGLISRGKKSACIAIAMILFTIVFWFTQPTGQKAWIFCLTVAGYALLAAVLGAFAAKPFLQKPNPLFKAAAVFLCAIAGMCGGGFFASFPQLLLFKMPVISFKVLAAVTPLERTVFSLATVIIGVPLLTALPKIGIFVGPAETSEPEEAFPETIDNPC